MNRGDALRRLATELELFRGASVEFTPGADGERTNLLINKVSASTLVQFYREGQLSRYSPVGRGGGRYRLNVGIPGHRRVFIEDRRGGFRWTEAAKTLLLAVQEIWNAKDPVAIQLSSSDDHFRLIPRDELFRIATQMDARGREAEIWGCSIPFETSATNNVDYVLVPHDDDSWKELRQTLEEE